MSRPGAVTSPDSILEIAAMLGAKSSGNLRITPFGAHFRAKMLGKARQCLGLSFEKQCFRKCDGYSANAFSAAVIVTASGLIPNFKLPMS